jgi:nucleoside-diphosphate-sugar epimerase
MSWHRCDLTDFRAVHDLVAKTRPDVLFHLASHVMGAPDRELVLPTFHANLQTTVNLLAACAEHGSPRVILTGSLVEPEPGRGERIPSSPYAAAKWASSDYGRMFHELYGLPVSIARVFMVYGPAQRDESKLVPYTIRCLSRGETPKITSGSRLIDWVYVDDVVSGFVAMARASGIDGQSIDLGSGHLISTRDLVEKITTMMNPSAKPDFGALPDRPLEPTRIANVQATFEAIGVRPEVTLERGLERTIAWFGSPKERP